MKKIPCLFKRVFYENSKFDLLQEVTEGCEWVLEGDGIATRKWDGTACMIEKGFLYARYDAKNGKPAPIEGIPCDVPDPVTGHWPYWVHATRQEDIWIRKAYEEYMFSLELDSLPHLSKGYNFLDGTYEAVGPKIGGNKDKQEKHTLKAHGEKILDVERSFEGIREFLYMNEIEGIVFYSSRRNMAKIRRTDFGFSWPVE